MFKEISIIGRTAYGIYALEEYLKEAGENLAEWDVFLKKLWSFPEFEYVDDYSYMFIECIPHCILEFEDFSSGGEWEYFTEDEFKVLQRLYKNSKNIDVIEQVMDWLREMLSVHLYTANIPPAQESLNIMNDKVYPFLKEKLKNIPSIEPFKIYSIKEEKCWGRFYSKEILLKKI